ncbi:unnamed protein product [Cyprideis torosa]|uniref:Uncharacterized protein n=1 Tax=Cyprideis torosa TaxID=163714 RepID=A0A7R8W644_9CRUS|nr:unnamed protein product [Cyprideis torosa]CAG0880621.1 unnamed protein product [Cyprideis torosa]
MTHRQFAPSAIVQNEFYSTRGLEPPTINYQHLDASYHDKSVVHFPLTRAKTPECLGVTPTNLRVPGERPNAWNEADVNTTTTRPKKTCQDDREVSDESIKSDNCVSKNSPTDLYKKQTFSFVSSQIMPTEPFSHQMPRNSARTTLSTWSTVDRTVQQPNLTPQFGPRTLVPLPQTPGSWLSQQPTPQGPSFRPSSSNTPTRPPAFMQPMSFAPLGLPTTRCRFVAHSPPELSVRVDRPWVPEAGESHQLVVSAPDESPKPDGHEKVLIPRPRRKESQAGSTLQNVAEDRSYCLPKTIVPRRRQEPEEPPRPRAPSRASPVEWDTHSPPARSSQQQSPVRHKSSRNHRKTSKTANAQVWGYAPGSSTKMLPSNQRDSATVLPMQFDLGMRFSNPASMNMQQLQAVNAAVDMMKTERGCTGFNAMDLGPALPPRLTNAAGGMRWGFAPSNNQLRLPPRSTRTSAGTVTPGTPNFQHWGGPQGMLPAALESQTSGNLWPHQIRGVPLTPEERHKRLEQIARAAKVVTDGTDPKTGGKDPTTVMMYF